MVSRFDAILVTTHVEHMRDVPCRGTIGVARWEGELDPILGQDSTDLVGHGGEQDDEEGRD